MSNNHHIAGLPEWADDETAAEAAKAVAIDDGGETEAENASESRQLAADWRAVAGRYWALAEIARVKGNFRKMRREAAAAKAAEGWADPVVIATVGAPRPSDALVEQAQDLGLAHHLVADARASVLVLMRAHKKRHEPRVAEEQGGSPQTEGDAIIAKALEGGPLGISGLFARLPWGEDEARVRVKDAEKRGVILRDRRGRYGTKMERVVR